MLEHLKPNRVFYYFEQICSIPHGSFHTKEISDYIVEIAKLHGLIYIQDELNNVIVIKEATHGYENEEPFILQGHMDMVTVKEEGCNKDFLKEGLDLVAEENRLYAKGTSLGADDGIAVAYCLAIMEATNLSHPKLEFVFTVDEEVGMEGALFIDVSMLEGKRLLNIDSETEGEITVSCAGGIRVNGHLRGKKEKIENMKEKSLISVTLSGLTGGHSGTEIHHHRGNSNVILGKFLGELSNLYHIQLVEFEGGLKDNAIPLFSKALFSIHDEFLNEFHENFNAYYAKIKAAYHKTDFNLKLEYSQKKCEEEYGFTDDQTSNMLSLFEEIPNGVIAMCESMPDLVETSCNVGIVSTKEDGFHVATSIRSSIASKKEELKERIMKAFTDLEGSALLTGDYPAWEYREDSKLSGCLARLYEEMFQKKADVISIHAGLECGILASKIPGLDAVSFGPNMDNIHTTKETLFIDSAERIWEFLVKIIENKS